MKRITTDNVNEMGIVGLAHNCCYIGKDGCARYRDFDIDIDARELAKELLKELANQDVDFESDEDFDEWIGSCYGEDGIGTIHGLIAMFYQNIWAMAELRENLNAVHHNNVVIFDDRGIPSIMCRYMRPQDTEETPAMFKIGDKVADAIYISKYPNVVINGRAYSLPMVDPTVCISFDEAVQACRAKGEGWHLMTAVEWEYLLNQSREKGTLPHGNTNYGKDYYHPNEEGERKNCGYGRTLTGSGPVTWNHDHTQYGVSDLNGNVWEWLAGLRIVNGIIEHIPGNNAASTYCDLSKDSKEWQQVKTNRGPVRVNVECGDIAIVDLPEHEEYEPDYDGVKIADLTVELSEIPQALRDLGIIPEKRLEEENNTYVWFDAKEGEYMPLRGSAFNDTSYSGPSALLLYGVRSHSYAYIGFRSAFYEVNGKLITE